MSGQRQDLYVKTLFNMQNEISYCTLLILQKYCAMIVNHVLNSVNCMKKVEKLPEPLLFYGKVCYAAQQNSVSLWSIYV